MNSENQHPRLFQTPPATGRFEAFLQGAGASFRGWQYLRQHPSLWRYAALPLGINLVITGFIFYMLVVSVVWFATEVHPRMAGGLESGWWWLAVAVEVLAGAILLLVCVVLAMLAWKLLNGILCGYFNGLLAEVVEQQLGVDPDELQSISFGRQVIDTLFNLTLLIVVNIGFLLLNIIPILGAVAAFVGSLYFTWFILGVDYLSMPLALRGVRRRGQFAFGHCCRMHTLGLGASIFVFEFIPVIGAVFLTTSTVGAVLLHRQLAIPETNNSESRRNEVQ
jgi:uncharacterized protein involved in cysteine biosynthesis